MRLRHRGIEVDARAGLRVLGVGAVLLAAAVLFDAEPLYVPGLALTALAVGAGAWTALAVAGARVERRIDRRRVVEGERLHARIAVRGGVIGLAGATLVDPMLGEPRTLPGRARSQRLRIDARYDRRGRRELAPPTLVGRDPLGLVAVRRAAAEPAASILVLPRVEPVVGVGGAGDDRAGAGSRHADPVAAATEIDGLQAWRPGTPASRIHWPALARGAGLVERRMLSEADGRPLLVLDPRQAADGLALDAAVRATASLAVHLARRGGCALLLPGDRRPVGLDADLHGWAALHVRLALLDGQGAPALAALGGRGGPVLLVLAHAPATPPRALVASPAARRVLVVPGELAGRRAAFRVGGCAGYDLARVAAGRRAA